MQDNSILCHRSATQAVNLCIPLLHDPSEALLTALQQHPSSVLSTWQRHAQHARRVGLLTMTYMLSEEASAWADMYVVFVILVLSPINHLHRLMCNMLMLASVATPLLLNKVQSRLTAVANAEGIFPGHVTDAIYVNGIGLVARTPSKKTHAPTKHIDTATDDTACSSRQRVESATPLTDGAKVLHSSSISVCDSTNASSGKAPADDGCSTMGRPTTPSGDDSDDDQHSSSSGGSCRGSGHFHPGTSSSAQASDSHSDASGSGHVRQRAGNKGGDASGNTSSAQGVSEVVKRPPAAAYAQRPWLRFVDPETEVRYLARALTTNLQVRCYTADNVVV